MEKRWIDVDKARSQTGTEAIAPRPWDCMQRHTGINIYMAASIAGHPLHPPTPPIVGLVTASWVHASQIKTRQQLGAGSWELRAESCRLTFCLPDYVTVSPE